jgi:hypothetical protein
VAVADVLQNLYQTQPGNPLVSGYNSITADVTSLFSAHPGETLRLRLAEADNVNFLNAGVDQISISVPEPTSLCLLIGGGLALLGTLFVRRRPQL